ncbi:MAG: iron-containing alcohol dehydrogenase [Bacilli bacterium]
MKNFIFENPTRIIFGKDTENQVGEEVSKYGKKILLHYGGGSIKKSGLYDKVIKSLKEHNIDFVELSGVVPNPRLSLVKEGIKICKEKKIDFILAVGGGSVIDSAKAIGIGAVYDKDVWDFYSGVARVEKTIPVGVVLTIPAAGSESSSSSVITNEDGWYKRSALAIIMRPKFAILNPELTYTLPFYQTACGIADMFSHVMERYFTNEQHVDFTDELCEATFRTIIKHGRKLVENPNDYNSRAEIMLASTIAHNGLLGVGRVEDWASHGIEHELSAIYDIAHGAGLAIVFPAWMKYVYKHDIDRFAKFSKNVFGVKGYDKEEIALKGIDALKEFYNYLGLKTSLKEVNITDEHFDEMAKKATINRKLGNFVPLDTSDVYNIYVLSK